MFDLLRARLEGLTSGGATLRSPVTGLRLGAERLEDGGTALSLFAGSDPDPEAVAIALARLDAALGPRAALRARTVPGFRFEARYAYEPFDASRIARGTAAATAAPDAAASARTAPIATLAYRIVSPRALDVRLARGAPAEVDARAVLECAGPWRSDEGWWCAALDELGGTAERIVYDAYDVLLDDGALLRIALRTSDAEAASHWYEIGRYD
jgi:hypothetical protein